MTSNYTAQHCAGLKYCDTAIAEDALPWPGRSRPELPSPIPGSSMHSGFLQNVEITARSTRSNCKRICFPLSPDPQHRYFWEQLGTRGLV
jgi:hypothetical protein